MLGATGDRGLGLIYAGRVLAGIGVGACSMITPIYISEIAPPAIRGRIVGIYELGWQLGGLVGFWYDTKGREPSFVPQTSTNFLLSGLTMVLPRQWHQATSNGSSHSPSN